MVDTLLPGTRPTWSAGTTNLASRRLPTGTPTTSGWAMAAPAITNAATGLLGAWMQSRAANAATRMQTRAAGQQLAYLREQSGRQDAMAREQWDAEQARLAPYRAAAARVLAAVMGGPSVGQMLEG
jgi:hypothetical protein